MEATKSAFSTDNELTRFKVKESRSGEYNSLMEGLSWDSSSRNTASLLKILRVKKGYWCQLSSRLKDDFRYSEVVKACKAGPDSMKWTKSVRFK